MAQAPRFEPLGQGAFTKTHAEFTDIDTFDWVALEASAKTFDAHTRERGRRAFVLRALDEQRSVVAFSELLTELCLSGAPIEVIGSLTRVVRDEALHVDMCDRVVKALGGWDEKSPQPTWVRSNKKLPLKLRVLQTVLGSLCVGETISVHMIKGVREHASEPVIHALLTRLLADESYHSRIGWWWLREIEMSDEERTFAKRYVAKMLPHIIKTMRPKLNGKKHTYSPFGSMSAEERLDAFDAAMHKTILPGFDAAGLEASAIWNELGRAA